MTGITCALAGGGPRPGTLTTVSFTSNGTWVAPAGVSTVVSASGKGANGVSDYVGTVYTAAYWASRNTVASPSAPYAQWGTLYNAYSTLLNALASKSYPSYAPTTPLPYGSFTNVAANDTWENITYTFTGVAYYLTGYSTSTIGAPQTSGNITYASLTDFTAGWTIDVTGYIAGGAGAASTALGQTFPGGTYTGSYPNGVGNAAVTTTFTNIAVTPGDSYPIVVPSGGVVTLQYYV